MQDFKYVTCGIVFAKNARSYVTFTIELFVYIFSHFIFLLRLNLRDNNDNMTLITNTRTDAAFHKTL